MRRLSFACIFTVYTPLTVAFASFMTFLYDFYEFTFVESCIPKIVCLFVCFFLWTLIPLPWSSFIMALSNLCSTLCEVGQ